MPNPSDLSIMMVFLRIGENWSQTQLAEAGGLPPSLINDYENGRKKLIGSSTMPSSSSCRIPPETVGKPENVDKVGKSRSKFRRSRAKYVLPLDQLKCGRPKVFVGHDKLKCPARK
jgi:hypothetical protein